MLNHRLFSFHIAHKHSIHNTHLPSRDNARWEADVGTDGQRSAIVRTLCGAVNRTWKIFRNETNNNGENKSTKEGESKEEKLKEGESKEEKLKEEEEE